MAVNHPFKLTPAVKDYLWGGDRLNTIFHKNCDVTPFAESWECSTHPSGLSKAADGEYAGQNLSDIIASHPDFLGTKYRSFGDLPIIVKLIDAAKDVSVQVHPSDEYAEIKENGQKGKTEMWYILHSDEDSYLICGLKEKVDKDIFRQSVVDGTVNKYLNYIPAKKGDSYFITPGTIHALGKGVMIAEIQQNSNLTYRLFDYNRLDKDGKKRELHVDKAMDVAILDKASPVTGDGDLLCSCAYFTVRKFKLQGSADYKTDDTSYTVMLCVDGCGVLEDSDTFIDFKMGETVFVPSNSDNLKLKGNANLLLIS